MLLDFAHVVAGREPGAVRDAEDVRVDRDRRLSERGVEDHVRGLAPDAGQRFERLARLGHLAAVLLQQRCGTVSITFFAFVLYRPIVLMYSRQAGDAELEDRLRRVGVLEQLAVARLTLLSVACADSTTATSSSNGVRYSSSVVGCGFSACRRAKIAATFFLFMSGGRRRRPVAGREQQPERK